MKQKATLLAAIMTFASLCLYSQDRDLEIQKIKGMYKEITDYFGQFSYSNCNNGSSMTTIETPTRMTYVQKAKSCEYPEGYKIIFSESEGWEWAAKINYYYKSNRLFFVLIKFEGVCGYRTERIYYNTAGRVIKVMQERDDCTEFTQKKNMEVFDRETRDYIISFSNTRLSEALRMLR